MTRIGAFNELAIGVAEHPRKPKVMPDAVHPGINRRRRLYPA
jgi:hypothetical protein